MKRGNTMDRPVTEIALAYGDAIYELRSHKSRRWSQRDLARAIGTSNSVVYQWEMGWTTPSRRSIDKLCSAFKMTRAEFKQRIDACRRDIRRVQREAAKQGSAVVLDGMNELSRIT